MQAPSAPQISSLICRPIELRRLDHFDRGKEDFPIDRLTFDPPAAD
jgi:hypothetical protein